MSVDILSTGTGNALESSVSIDSTRQLFNFGERVAELAPQQSPFFVYLSKVAKKATDDPVFKFLESRHQWQRRSFEVVSGGAHGVLAAGADFGTTGTDLVFDCGYDKYGNIGNANTDACYFLIPGQVIALAGDDGSVYRLKIKSTATIVHVDAVQGTSDGTTSIDYADIEAVEAIPDAGDFAEDAKCQVIGSAFAEGSGAPASWKDEMYDREGYVQIFKTACPMFSGSAMATRYRGKADEFKRVWTEKLMEHKMDIEQAMLFGVGSHTDADTRYSWGIVPYTEQYGKVYNFSYASSGYDAFLDAMEDFFSMEGGNSGNKLVLASRKIITYLNKLGGGSFLNNTVGASQYSLDVKNIPGSFGHNVTTVDTIYGNLHFVAEPLLRGPWEDYAVAVDLKNVAYRPLVGNGNSRDTFIETNIQGNDEDGRKDQIITEAGLEISLPETHAILKFS